MYTLVVARTGFLCWSYLDNETVARIMPLGFNVAIDLAMEPAKLHQLVTMLSMRWVNHQLKREREGGEHYM